MPDEDDLEPFPLGKPIRPEQAHAERWEPVDPRNPYI